MNEHEQLDFDLVPVTWSAMQVIDGSFVLTANEKRLLFKVYGFSRHDGCYASTSTLADRLGLKPRTIEDTRTRLRKLGLLLVQRRQYKPSIWTIQITRDAVPPDANRIDADTFMKYRERVDNWLEFQERRHLDPNVKPVRERVQKPVRERVCIGEEGKQRRGTPPPSPPEGEDSQKLSADVENYMQRHMQRRGYA